MGPTKADELATWRDFVAARPECSYLYSYLQGSEELLAGYMAQDMACELVAEIRKRRDWVSEELRTVEARLEVARAELKALERQVEALKGEGRYVAGKLREVREEARAFYGVACRAELQGEAFTRAVK